MGAAMLFAYLFLVAQYESWSIPVSVMLSVLVALTGAFLGLWLTNTALSIYAQLGCVMLIGLSTKNAILMVEFARQQRSAGKSVTDAAINGGDLRFRAVMMTAWSFIFGVMPLVVGPDGRRLAKRHGDTRISAFRAAGVSAERIIGYLAQSLGIVPDRKPIGLRSLTSLFDPARIPHAPLVFNGFT